jgi:hypothetical protein
MRARGLNAIPFKLTRYNLLRIAHSVTSEINQLTS